MNAHTLGFVELVAVFVALCRTMILVMRDPRPVHLMPERRRRGAFWSTWPSLR